MPPISLLYDGFGIFDDVFNESAPVPGESDILEIRLWDMVGKFAEGMSAFYPSDAARRGALHGHLEEIFGARRNTLAGGGILASKIGSRQIITDGHLNGAHGAIVFCVECKNELSGITSEPSVELVSYVASSFKEGLQKHPALFEGWRAPALGMIQIGGWTQHTLRLHPLTQHSGSYVQFYGIVMIVQMRAVPLTPMLPLQTSTNDELSRRRIFLAFKAASIVVAKIQADVLQHIQKPPLAIHHTFRQFPSVTEISSTADPLSQPEPIRFTLLKRYDEITSRNLYHAVTSTGGEIFVKFTQRYSRELHAFCTQKRLAPELLGFERLPGGWFALAMEKVLTVDVSKIGSRLRSDGWKKDIGNLVHEFHKKGLVHGDLRPPNFIFTAATPHRMLLVDFDWGGKERQVFFPPGDLAPGLRDEYDHLDLPITKQDDNRVLSATFRWLDERTEGDVGAKANTDVGTEMDVDPVGHA